MTKTALDTPEAPRGAVPVCGCCGGEKRRLTELGLRPGVFICRRCAVWAFRRAAPTGLGRACR